MRNAGGTTGSRQWLLHKPSQVSPLQLELRAQYDSWADSRIASATNFAKAKARVQGGGSDGLAGGAMLSGSGSSKDFAGLAEAYDGFYAQAVASSSGEGIRFTLSPWTALVMSVDGNVNLAGTRTGDASESAVVLSMTLDGMEEHRDEFQFSCSGACKLAEARTLSVTVANESDAAAGGQWWAMGTVNGSSMATTAGAKARKGGPAARKSPWLRSMLGATGLTARPASAR